MAMAIILTQKQLIKTLTKVPTDKSKLATPSTPWLAWIMSVTAKAAKTAKMDTLKPLNQCQISMA